MVIAATQKLERNVKLDQDRELLGRVRRASARLGAL